MYTCIYLYIPVYTCVYLCIPVYTCVYLYLYVHSTVYAYLNLYIGMGELFVLVLYTHVQLELVMVELSSGVVRGEQWGRFGYYSH